MMTTTLIILLITVALFISGKVRSDLVAFCSMLSLVISGVLTPTEALTCYGDPIVFVIIGLFVVSAGVMRTGLAQMLGEKIITLAGDNETRLYIFMMLIATVMGVFITGTGTVAIFIPIIASMSISKNISVSRYLMPLGFLAGIGSTYTLMNTSNLAVNRVFIQEGLKGMGFFSFAPLGIIASLVGIVLLYFLSKLFLDKRQYGESSNKDSKTFDELANEYKLEGKTFFAIISAGSPLVGVALGELKIAEKYKVNIIQVVHKKNNRKFPKAELACSYTVLSPGDNIEFIGSKEAIEKFVTENNLHTAPVEKMDSAQGIAEVLLMPASRMSGILVKDSGFREKYGVTILAINRKGEYITDNIREEKMNVGDALLVQGTWDGLAMLDKDYANLVVVGKPMEHADKATIDSKAPIAGAILLLMVIVLTTGVLPTSIVILSAAVLMVFSGCIRNMEEAYRSVNWGSIVVIASMMPMAVAMHKTGMDVLISGWFTEVLGDKSPYLMMTVMYLIIQLMTFFINGTPVAVLFAPIAYQTAVHAGVSPYPFLITVAVAANMYFASTFSSAINIMMMTAGRYSNKDFLKLGLPMQAVIMAVMIFVIPVFFPFH